MQTENNKNIHSKFILCFDKQLSKKLSTCCHLLYTTNEMTVFENLPMNTCLTLTDEEKKQCTYTNRLIFTERR